MKFLCNTALGILLAFSVNVFSEPFPISELDIAFSPSSETDIQKLRVQSDDLSKVSMFLAHDVMFVITRSNIKDQDNLPVSHNSRQDSLRSAMVRNGVEINSTNMGQVAGLEAYIIQGEKSSMYQYSATMIKEGYIVRVLLVSPEGPPKDNEKAMTLLSSFTINP